MSDEHGRDQHHSHGPGHAHGTFARGQETSDSADKDHVGDFAEGQEHGEHEHHHHDPHAHDHDDHDHDDHDDHGQG